MSQSVQKQRRAFIRTLYHDLGSWRAVARLLDLPKSTVHKFGTTDWMPKRKSVKVKLGLEEKVDYIRQVRSSDGTFHRKETP